jgi:hypothetical protein
MKHTYMWSNGQQAWKELEGEEGKRVVKCGGFGRDLGSLSEVGCKGNVKRRVLWLKCFLRTCSEWLFLLLQKIGLEGSWRSLLRPFLSLSFVSQCKERTGGGGAYGVMVFFVWG